MASAGDSEAERGDAGLLASVPDVLCVGAMLKATPSQEGDDRIVYIQASDESVDAQGERVLCKALQESAADFAKYGVVDIDHITMLRERSGKPNWREYEVGRPVEVRFDGNKTFVKACLYSGDTPLAHNANVVWDSMTKLSPPKRWYASIGGTTRAKSVEIDPVSKARVPVIKAVNWYNLALAEQPVNRGVGTASAAPFGAFAKSVGGFVFGDTLKTLTAGYGTDVATLEGGGALREQSLDERVQSYWDFSEKLASALRKGAVRRDECAMREHATAAFGLRADKATAWVSRFVADLHEALQNKRKN